LGAFRLDLHPVVCRLGMDGSLLHSAALSSLSGFPEQNQGA
jgi:hypothetical protein